MDTVYFDAALASWNMKRHMSDWACDASELTPKQLSEVLQMAQKLKQEDQEN
jgi:hypothetical protein